MNNESLINAKIPLFIILSFLTTRTLLRRAIFTACSIHLWHHIKKSLQCVFKRNKLHNFSISTISELTNIAAPFYLSHLKYLCFNCHISNFWILFVIPQLFGVTYSWIRTFLFVISQIFSCIFDGAASHWCLKSIWKILFKISEVQGKCSFSQMLLFTFFSS